MTISHPKKILDDLATGEIKLEGEFIHGSNYTFLVRIYPEDRESFLGVYKPIKGEQLLWDFPDNTLAHREVAAFLVGQALGWNLVPPTVFRDDGPYGAGSVQLFIEHDPNAHYFSFSQAEVQALRPVVIFDLVINNADRKGGHIILGEDDQIWLIDHGVCFNIDEKLRTVVWDFSGEPISNDLCEALRALIDLLEEPTEFFSLLHRFLSKEEIIALSERAKALLESKEFPYPPENRRAYPYPPI